MQQFIGYLFILSLFACNTQDKQSANLASPAALTGKTAHSASFTRSFKAGLDAYYTLKEGFVGEQKPAIDTAAKHLMYAIDQILLDSLDTDSTIILTAKSYTQGINAELKGLIGEQDIEEKRKAFQMVGEQLYDLIRTVQYDAEVVYHQYCPMAFNNEGATWLSNVATIRNPYIPTKMLGCGELRDSIDFRIKNK